MAGIGFQLRRILEEDKPLAFLKAYCFSALISSGPWIFSMVTLAILNWMTLRNLDMSDQTYFRAIVVYAFACSYVVVGFLVLPVTRRTADKLYEGDERGLAPLFNSAAAVLVTLLIATAPLFGIAVGGDVGTRMLSAMIYVTMAFVWLLMVMLTTLRNHWPIVIAYMAGSLSTVILSDPLGAHYALKGYLAGYLMGHLVIVVVLSARIFAEFPSRRSIDWEFVWDLPALWLFALTGMLYHGALWVDKIVMWLAPSSSSIGRWLRVAPTYEAPVFLAYLTIIPALSLFLMIVETRFYESYRRFYAAILEHAPLPVIQLQREELGGKIREGLILIAKYQGFITAAVILFAYPLAPLLNLPWASVPLFRVATVGAFLHSLLTVIFIIVLYFDFKKLALGIAGLFFVTEAVFTWWASRLGTEFLGYGYFLSTFVTVMVGYYALEARFKKLEYLTFAMQPMARHREEESFSVAEESILSETGPK